MTIGKEIFIYSLLEIREVAMIVKTRNPLKELIELRKEIKFSKREIEEMIKESKKEWSKFE